MKKQKKRVANKRLQRKLQTFDPQPKPVPITPTQWPKLKLFASATPPQLTYRGGPVISNVQVYNIFWGQAWTSNSNVNQTMQQANQFMATITNSPLLDQMGEYSTAMQSIGRGSLADSFIITENSPFFITFDFSIQNLLKTKINNGEFPAPSPNSVYFVYLPPGVHVIKGFAISCLVFCGYHDAINSNIFYAVVPYPDCGGCKGSFSVFDALTMIASHELCEAVTDPVPGTGWYDDNNGEIGDICPFQPKQVSGYTVQKEFSNAANQCV